MSVFPPQVQAVVQQPDLLRIDDGLGGPGAEPMSNGVLAIQSPIPAGIDPRRVPVDVEIVVPVYNEAHVLAEQITTLRSFLDESFPLRAVVTIVDNASTDATFAEAERLASLMPGVAAMHLDQKGKGLALRAAWSTSEAPVVAYMDVDLSTSLVGLLPLVAPLLSGQRDVVIGSRLAPGAHVIRGPKRELISRSYNLLVKVALRGRFSDAQCGFKALRRDAAQRVLPMVHDNQWFFDTELLVTAERLGLRVGEVPVDWVDDPDSRVRIMSAVSDDLRGVGRMMVRRPKELRPSPLNEVAADQLMRFAGIGVLSTLGYLLLFIAFRLPLGPFGANALAIAVTTLLNTSIHWELSRSADGQPHRGRFLAVAGGLFAVSLGLTTLGLIVAQWLSPSALIPELVAIAISSVIASVIRFTVLRAWIFRPGSRHRQKVQLATALT
jgi:putative flippase GtrA